ncbi:MAG: LOG family protein [Candidatus Pacebacteria bacterium]|nr:LOG family protein [Candidatus Paceibacterota bacterium]
MKKKISVFAGNDCVKGKQNYYFELAYKTGRLLAENGFVTITGAGSGLMEEAMKGAFEAGGETIGVGLDFRHTKIMSEDVEPKASNISDYFEGRQQSKYVKDVEVFKLLGPRQEKIIKLADAFIALPGGVGTFFEVFNVLALKRLREIPKDVPLILIGKYFSILKETLDTMIKEGFLESSGSSLYRIVETPEEAVRILNDNFKS